MKKSFGLYLLLLGLIVFSCKQTTLEDPHRFDDTINRFKTMEVPQSGEVVVFTGSSSIRFWEEVAADCPADHVINTGFGGSQTHDLLYFLDETVLRFNPSTVYIYEGDNDIAAEKRVSDIISNTEEIATRILKELPNAQLKFISAKPSPSRWQYKNAYVVFNAALKAFADTNEQFTFIDVWNPMINEKGRPSPEIFIEDSLHMNRKGYELWRAVICGSGDQ